MQVLHSGTPGTLLALPELQTGKNYTSVQFCHIFFLLEEKNSHFGCFNAWTLLGKETGEEKAHLNHLKPIRVLRDADLG